MNATVGSITHTEATRKPLTAALDRVEIATSRLDEAMHALHDRASPVVSPEPPAPADATLKAVQVASHQNVTFATELHSVAERLEGHAAGLESLVKRFGI